jgi:predicted Fe-S protein YdhL (DUF1289 family)
MRTLDEIAAWGTMDADEKRRIWSLLPVRRSRAVAGPGRS